MALSNLSLERAIQALFQVTLLAFIPLKLEGVMEHFKRGCNAKDFNLMGSRKPANFHSSVNARLSSCHQQLIKEYFMKLLEDVIQFKASIELELNLHLKASVATYILDLLHTLSKIVQDAPSVLVDISQVPSSTIASSYA